MKFKDLIYKASKSGSRQEVAQPDSENIGLDKFNKPQKSIIEKAEESVIIQGGIEGIGKTHMVKELIRRGEYFGFDFYLIGQYLVSGDIKGAVKKIMEKYDKEQSKAETILLDESYSGIVDKSRDGRLTPEKISQLIYKLLERFSKVVLLGGGPEYTSEEQTTMIAELMPRDIEILLAPFPLKPFNNKQLFELAKRIKYGVFQWSNRQGVEILPNETAMLIANVVEPYFRVPRPAVKLLLGLEDLKRRGMDTVSSDVRTGIMPEDVFNRAWAVQVEKIEKIKKNN